MTFLAAAPSETRTPGGTSREPIRFFLPGPTYVTSEVREAMLRPVVAHRSRAFREVYESLSQRLPRVFRTRGEVLVATGSSTLLMESAVVSTVGSSSGSRVLNLTQGAFSERWHEICLSLGKRADRVSVPWGQPVDPELVRRALRRRSYEAVTVVHNETSTGALSPLEEIARVVRESSDALLLVDAVSSLGGAPVEVEAWGLDVVLTGSQKALAAPPGLALCAVSERAYERAGRVAHRGYYTDLLRYRDQHRRVGTITTPAVSVVWALDRQLDRVLEEGMVARWARHEALRRATDAWAAASGFLDAAEASARSPTMSCLRPPAGVEADDLVKALEQRGFTVAGGYGQWKGKTLRIGHMGEATLADLEDLLAALDEAVAALKEGGRERP